MRPALPTPFADTPVELGKAQAQHLARCQKQQQGERPKPRQQNMPQQAARGQRQYQQCKSQQSLYMSFLLFF